jgi:hypothetical protein
MHKIIERRSGSPSSGHKDKTAQALTQTTELKGKFHMITKEIEESQKN